MPEIIDLSTLGKRGVEDTADFDSLSPEQQEELTALAEDAKPDVQPAHKVRTAFLVVVQENGDVFATSDLDIEMERSYIPQGDDIYGACAVVQRDVQIQMGVQHTVIGMQQMAAQAQQQMQAQQIASRLNLPK